MENKVLVSVKNITKEIIGNFLLWEIILQFVDIVVFSLITKNVNSNFLIVCIEIFLQVLIAVFVWKITLAKSFKKKIILFKDIPQLMKNLFILVIIMCFIMVIYNISNVNSTINEALQNNEKIQFLDAFVNSINDQNVSSKYQEQKQKAIENVKNEAYKLLIVFDTSFVLVNLIILPFERKQLFNYAAIEEDNIVQ